MMTGIASIRGHLIAVLAILALLGCDDGEKPPLPQPDVDADADAPTDTADVPDDGTDVPTDTPTDTTIPDVDVESPCACPNGVTETACGEQCDDDNWDNFDDCTTECQIATCGDGHLRSNPADAADAEECDDGNDVAGDGCENDCTYTCHTDLECDDGDSCNTDICDADLHVCDHVADPLADGTVCDPGDVCTGVGSCVSGVCTYSGGLECDDYQPCTTDSCDVTEGCVFTPMAEGDPCDDGLFCTTGDQCWGIYGFCMGDEGHPCDDSDPCTVDSCNEDTDSCIHDSPTYREVACGGEARATLSGGTSSYGNVSCPGGMFSIPGPDDIQQVVVASSGTMTIDVLETSTAGTQVFVLTDPCDITSCIANGDGTTNATATVTAGTTYYVLAETAGNYAWNVTCP